MAVKPLKSKIPRNGLISHTTISMTYDPHRETFRFAWRKCSFRFAGFWTGLEAEGFARASHLQSRLGPVLMQKSDSQKVAQRSR
jgi:hypothetical protein